MIKTVIGNIIYYHQCESERELPIQKLMYVADYVIDSKNERVIKCRTSLEMVFDQIKIAD